MKSYSALEGEMNQGKKIGGGICFHMTKKKWNYESMGQRLTRRLFQRAETLKKKAFAFTVMSFFGGTEKKPVQSYE